MKINQFHSGTAFGDAITNQMLMLRQMLIDAGYESEIYAEYIDEKLEDQIKPIREYSGNKDGILFVHHSMGMGCFDKIISLPDKKSIIYHNITPEYFFEDEGLKREIKRGLDQTKKYAKYVDYAVADSNYNRRELLDMGYKHVDVMPIQISLDRFDKTQTDSSILEQYSHSTNIIFVGRVVQNKRQDDLIKIFAVYHNFYNTNSHLHIVGDDGMHGYVAELKRECSAFGLDEYVHFTGKVSEEKLKAYYELADIFLCMSEHEGFGVPLLEAMRMGVPVISFSSSAIPETMGGAGVLSTDKNYAYIGALCNEIIEDADLRNKIITHQKNRIKRLETTDTKAIFFRIIENIKNGIHQRNIQLQGPFESSYSLAIVNRKLMEKMDDLAVNDNISIYCTEGPGDYEPKEKDLVGKEHAKKLWLKSKDVTYPDVVIRNMYPPRVADTNGALNFQAFGWEETVIPPQYIANFNKYLDGIGTMSDFVTDILIENGIKIPVKTMGIGVELVENFDTLAPYPIKSKKQTKFLHISSAFPRKGVDVLLRGYFEAFTVNDDVCLILKTFPNPHNTVGEQLEQLRKEFANPPEVEWINYDLTDQELNSLYKAADCYVQTARGEGFGLPVAEAMLAKLPVIVCPNTGMADFSKPETAVLVKYEQAPAVTHVTTHGNKISMWYEPDKDDLIEKLKSFVYNRDSLDIEEKVENAYQLISREFSWEAVAKRWYAFIDEVAEIQVAPRVSMVTTWNSKCGIAEYTKMEVEATQSHINYRIYPDYVSKQLVMDEPFVAKRLWGSTFEGDMEALIHTLEIDSSDIVHFQFNYGFFQLTNLAKAIEELHDKKKIVITFHKTEDAEVGGKIVSLKSIAKQLNKCAALIVHQESDQVILESYGISPSIIFVVTHGQVVYPEINAKYAKKKKNIASSVVIGSYGFCLPHKGIKEVIEAIAVLREMYPDILYMPVCAMHDDPSSKNYVKECKDTIERLHLEQNVKMITDFLPNDESMAYLQACDMLIMPYKPTTESASGAIRFCLAAQRPIITTRQPIFDEFKDFSFQIESCDVHEIVMGIQNVLDNEEISLASLKKLKTYVSDISWYNTDMKLYNIYRKLL